MNLRLQSMLLCMSRPPLSAYAHTWMHGWVRCFFLTCLTNQGRHLSSTHTDASIYGFHNISTKSIWRVNSVDKSVFVTLCAVPVRDSLDVELVIILWNCSWLSNLVFKMPSYYPGVAGRERERESERKNCHSKFIYILVLQCVRPVILTHSTYHFVSGPQKLISYSFCCHPSLQDYPI